MAINNSTNNPHSIIIVREYSFLQSISNRNDFTRDIKHRNLPLRYLEIYPPISCNGYLHNRMNNFTVFYPIVSSSA
jgi:hypothetical protein